MTNWKEAFDIIIKSHNSNHIGENVTQFDHDILSYYIAKKNNFSINVMIASFFHDIGHQLAKNMNNDLISSSGEYLGCVSHEDIGSQYLYNCGFPVNITELIKNHVNAKRYLAYVDPNYIDKLSDASKKTLILQNGIMTDYEALNFSSCSYFEESINVR